MTIAHGPGNQPPASYTRTDALDLAGQSEQAWRDLLALRGDPMPA